MTTTRLAICADLHLANHDRFGGPVMHGLNRRARLVLDCWARALQVACREDAQAVLLLGDCFHQDRPSPQLVAGFARVTREAGIPVWITPGNHDQTSELPGLDQPGMPGHHALASLQGLPGIWVVDRARVVDIQGVRVALAPHQQDREALLVWLAGCAHECALAGLHVGLEDLQTPAWLQQAGVPVDALPDLPVWAGHWHTRRVWPGPPPRVQQGSLCPHGFNDPSPEHGIDLVDCRDQRVVQVRHIPIPGPRFVQTTDLAAIRQDALQFVELVVPVDQLAAARAHVVALGAAPRVEVLPDIQQAQGRAGELARATQQVVQLGEHVQRFVAGMPLIPPGVERGSVVRRCLAFLAVPPAR